MHVHDTKGGLKVWARMSVSKAPGLLLLGGIFGGLVIISI